MESELCVVCRNIVEGLRQWLHAPGVVISRDELCMVLSFKGDTIHSLSFDNPLLEVEGDYRQRQNKKSLQREIYNKICEELNTFEKQYQKDHRSDFKIGQYNVFRRFIGERTLLQLEEDVESGLIRQKIESIIEELKKQYPDHFSDNK